MRVEMIKVEILNSERLKRFREKDDRFTETGHGIKWKRCYNR